MQSIATWIAVGVSAVALVLVLGARVRQLALVNHDSGGVSQNVVYGVQTLLSTGKLYSDPSQPPYAVMQYSPLFYYLNAALAVVLRIADDQVQALYTLCRSTALLFNLAAPVVLYALIRRFGVPRLASIVTAAWGFTFIYITDYCRPDSLYHLLTFGAAYCLVKYADERKPRELLLSVGLSVLALYTKQSALVLPAITVCVLWLLDRNWVAIGKALGLYLGLSLALFALFAAVNGGVHVLLENVHGGIDNGVDLDWFYRRIVEYYGRELAGWAALIAASCAWLHSNSKGNSDAKTDPRVVVLTTSVFWHLAFALLTSLKWGSMPSYFTPFLLLGFCSIAIALLSPRYRPADGRWSKLTFSLIVTIALVFNVPVTLKWSWLDDESERFAHASLVAQFLRTEKALQPNEGVMSLIQGELTLETSFLNNLLHGNAIFPQKDVVTCCAFKRKRFDYSDVPAQANGGLVKYLIKGRDQRLDAYAGGRFTQFRRIKTLHEFDIYEFTATP